MINYNIYKDAGYGMEFTKSVPTTTQADIERLKALKEDIRKVMIVEKSAELGDSVYSTDYVKCR